MRSGAQPAASPDPASQGRLALVPPDSIDSRVRTGRVVARLTPFKRMELGLRAASQYLYQQDKIWARYSNDKVDVGDTLTTTLRTLSKALPLEAPLTALSIGSSIEPQFRILQSACRGGLYLLDQEAAALQQVEDRIARQNIRHVGLIRGDYRELLRDERAVRLFRHRRLHGQHMSLVLLHHSLYYCRRDAWNGLLANLYQHLLAPEFDTGISGAIHAVMAASRADEPMSAMWLYDHFARRFLGQRNDQDLEACAAELRTDPRLADAQVLTKSTRVEFFVDDFEQYMAGVWMVLLHPNVHRFTEDQQREVTEWIYEQLWSRGRPLVQAQDHLVIYRGRGVPGLI
jgi:hypothetical protein